MGSESAEVASIYDVPREYKSPPPPDNISPRAARFWADVHTHWQDFGPQDDVVLEQVCHALTMAEQLRDEQSRLDLLTIDKVGRVSAAPLLSEMRGWNTTIMGLIKQLKLPEAPVATGPELDADGLPRGHAAGIADAAVRSAKMRALAMKRWNKPSSYLPRTDA